MGGRGEEMERGCHVAEISEIKIYFFSFYSLVLPFIVVVKSRFFFNPNYLF